jgi:NodT family efflux transporter outer membrane factor (OMF) lipoprotein
MIMALVLVSAGGLAACAMGPDFVEPSPPENASYLRKSLTVTTASTGPGGASQKFADGADVPGEWWKLFRSPQISALVKEAIDNHPDLAAAELALRQAREIVISEETQLLPQLANNSYLYRQKGVAPSSSSPSSPTGFGSSDLYTLYNVTANVSYTPDIWSRVARQVESDNAQAEFQRFQMEATYLTLTANVVTAAIKDSSYARQIASARNLINSYRNQLDMLEKRFALGAIGAADVETQRTLTAQSQAKLAPLEKERAIIRHQLMALLGRYPNNDNGEAVNLDSLHLPGELPLSLPSILVRQRPDVLAAESRMMKASALIGVSTANMLPRISLTPSIGLLGFAVDGLFSYSGLTWGAPAIENVQLFDAGGMAYQREAAVTAFRQTQEQYKFTVVKAFQNVADVLSTLEQDALELRAQTSAENAASEALRIAKVQYTAGSTAYWSVLNAEQSLFTTRMARVEAQAARYADTVALFQALGGGWWNRMDETPSATPKPKDLISMSPLATAIRAGAANLQKTGQ